MSIEHADAAHGHELLESIPTERTRETVNRLSKTGAGLLLARLATRLELQLVAEGMGVALSDLHALLAGERGLTPIQQLRLADTALAAFPPGSELHRRAAAVRGQVRAAYDYEVADRSTPAHTRPHALVRAVRP